MIYMPEFTSILPLTYFVPLVSRVASVRDFREKPNKKISVSEFREFREKLPYFGLKIREFFKMQKSVNSQAANNSLLRVLSSM